MVLNREALPPRTTPRAPRRPGRSIVPLALALAVLSSEGCDDVDFSARLGAGGASVGFVTPSTRAIVGQWLAVTAGPGAYGTEITWDFRSDGTAKRTTVTRTQFGGVVATSEEVFGWRDGGPGVLIINFGPPSFRISQVPFSISYGVNATVLLLEGLEYTRVAQ